MRLPGSDGQDGRGGRTTLGEAFQGQAGVEERMQQLGQRVVGGADLVAHPLVGQWDLAVELARALPYALISP